jgi:hypothetical protein
VLAADQKEMKAFVDHKVFRCIHRRDLPQGANVVDCVWIRKWTTHGKVVKSRMCARGCFDKQKWTIERHSSTATRLSQRMVVSLGMCEGIVNAGPYDEVITESLDISTAFLQGLNYEDLERHARTLGYEHRKQRRVFISPPENIWRHFRAIKGTPAELQIHDSQRRHYVLECLCAMYGFCDAPLMFQLALIMFLKQHTGARASVYDDNFLFWHEHQQVILIMTVHVDDLQITGGKKAREWIHNCFSSASE